MSISQLFAENALVRLFRADAGRAELVLSMVGVKLGDRLLVEGLSEPGLLATLGSKVGITGRACGVDVSPDAVRRAQQKAEREGVLAEVEVWNGQELPYERGAFDLVVVRAAGELLGDAALRTALDAAGHVLREGGRCLILAAGRPTGLRRLLDRADGGPGPGPHFATLLGTLGFRGPRVLAEREGMIFVEAIHLQR
jgi:SAM-dependent methyltransferase